MRIANPTPPKWLLLTMSLLASVGCDSPAILQPPVGESSKMMHVFMVLDPAYTTQVLLVEPVGADQPLDGVVASMYRIDAGDSVLVADGTTTAGLAPCIDRYGRIDGWDFACAVFPISVVPETEYLVRIWATDRPTATARVVVPGDFDIDSVEASGTPPGTGRLIAEWSESAYRKGYFVTVRPSSEPACIRTATCPSGWFISTDVNHVDTSISPELLPDHSGSWLLEIHALDPVLFDHLTTGSGGTLFPVSPRQNVEGGFGAVGAWVSRRRLLP